jgi:hypothetical protein
VKPGDDDPIRIIGSWAWLSGKPETNPWFVMPASHLMLGKNGRRRLAALGSILNILLDAVDRDSPALDEARQIAQEALRVER